MSQIMFSKDDSDDLSHPTYSYNATGMFFSSNGGICVPSSWTWADLCWLPWPIEYGGSGNIQLLKLGHKKCHSFLLYFIGSFGLGTQPTYYEEAQLAHIETPYKRPRIGVPANSQVEIPADHQHQSLASITCEYKSCQMISYINHWVTLNLWCFLVEDSTIREQR